MTKFVPIINQAKISPKRGLYTNSMRNLFFVPITLAAFLLSYSTANAQIVERKTLETKREVKHLANSAFRIAFIGDNEKMYTLKSTPVFEDGGVQNFFFNPTGASIAVIFEKRPTVNIYSFHTSNTLLYPIKDKRKHLPAKPYPTAVCYGADARNMIVANTLGELVVYDTKDYMPKAYIQGEAPAKSIAMSSNNYFIASAVEDKVVVWNFQTQKQRAELPMGVEVNEVVFSPDASMLAVLTANGKITIFDTKTWKESKSFEGLGENISSISFHPDGKYFSFVDNNSRIVVVNHITEKVALKFGEVADNSIKSAVFFRNNSNNDLFVLSNTANKIIFWNANELVPFYSKNLNSRVDAMMTDWIKQLDGESDAEYAERVNEETRLYQQQLFAQEIATEMAGDRISVSNPFIGEFDAEAGMLNIGFDNMQGIQLALSEEEAQQLKTSSGLKFENAVYILNDSDEFELAYVEVRNEITDKVYIYDNIGRLNLQKLEDDFDYVPLEIMQQASLEEVKLEAIKEQVVEENKEESLISDHTKINVKTTVVPDVNADGQKILNYKIGYQYEVINKEYSAKDDFPAGQFITEKSNAAMSLMKIIEQAFEGDFAKYLSSGKEVRIAITGSADASRILNTKSYDERYGRFVDEPYYKDGNLDNITITKESGISTNEQLALMRAAGVHHYIVNNISTLKDTKNSYEYRVEVAKEKGSEFRRINVEFVIVDAFPQR